MPRSERPRRGSNQTQTQMSRKPASRISWRPRSRQEAETTRRAKLARLWSISPVLSMTVEVQKAPTYALSTALERARRVMRFRVGNAGDDRAHGHEVRLPRRVRYVTGDGCGTSRREGIVCRMKIRRDG